LKVSENEYRLFFSIYFPLLYYANDYFNLYKNITSMEELFHQKIERLQKIRNAIFTKKTVFDSFINDNKSSFTKNEIETIKLWKDKGCLQQLLFLKKKNESLFYNISTKERIELFGLMDDPDNIPILDTWPIILKTALLPLNDKIIWDGIFVITEFVNNELIKDILRKEIM